MGNLPASRTITLSPADAFPSSLGNEIQDKIIARSAKGYWRSFDLIPGNNTWTSGLINGSGTLRLAFNANAATDTRYVVPMEQGDILGGIRIWASTSGTSTVSGQIVQASTMTSSDFPMFTWSQLVPNTGVWTMLVAAATANVPPAVASGVQTVISITNTGNTSIARNAEVFISRP